MSRIAELRHVLVKDLREAWWLAAAYVALVALATAQAVGRLPGPIAQLAGYSFFVSLAAAFLVALVVQADSPTRSDAWWATHPLRPSAVLGAKVAFALLVIAVAAIGQLIAVQSHEVSGARLWSVTAAGVPVLGLYLLAAMVASALARDLRGFALTIVGGVVALFAFTSAIMTLFGRATGALISNPEGVGIRPDLIATALGLLLLSWLYRRRDARIGVKVAGLSIAGFAVLSAAYHVADAGSLGSPSSGRPPFALQLLGDRVRANGYELDVFVQGTAASPLDRLAFTNGIAELRLRDGTVLRIPIENSLHELTPGRAAMPRDLDVRWLGRGEDQEGRVYTSLRVRLTPEQRRAVAGGIASVVLEGRIVVVEGRALESMPVTQGSSIAHDGRRVRIENWTTEFAEPTITLSTTSLSAPASQAVWPLWALRGTMQAAFVNREKGEALVLHQGRSSGSSSALVLPGVSVERRTTDFSGGWMQRPPGARVALVDDEWLRGAELLLVEQVPGDTYPIRLEAAVP